MKEYRDEDGLYHQVNGPAIEWEDGDGSWWYDGQRHRYYGPACHYYSNHYSNREYWIFNEKIK